VEIALPLLIAMATATKREEEPSLFELAQKLLAQGRELLEQDLNNARQEKETIEEITKTLNEVHFASTIKLNVGGKIYKTTLDTLKKDPDSMLCAMFSGRFELKVDEDDGAYFIDRDGELFRYILNYLRNGELLCPDDKTIQKELLKEALFYQIQGIIDQLQGYISPFEGSLIIKRESHQAALMSWLPPNSTCSLLYQSSTDGKKPADFHHCCDNKGPTLVLIKSGEYIFGGYTSQSWESADKFKADDLSFLFALISPSGTQPIKLSAKPSADQHSGGILCRTSMGPCFGSKNYFGIKLCDAIDGNDFLRDGSRAAFICPSNVTLSCFTPEVHFDISELEIFKVNFES